MPVPTAPSAASEQQQVIGLARIDERYRLVERMGQGGMGVVYRALDQATGRSLALKLLTYRAESELLRERERLRFRREFYTMARLRHPRIVETFDYGVAAGQPYYTMELLDGRDAQSLAPIDAIAACRILRDVASALAFLHAQRLVHRDIAPGNVRCTSDGHAKLIDFGVVATTGLVGEVVGTPPCIAPEVVGGLPLDPRADLFGLGALAYFMLTGRHAYPARHVRDLEAVWRHALVPPSAIRGDLPAPLDQLVVSLLSFDPLARPGLLELIERLGTLGGLEPPSEIEIAHGHITSAPMVGRKREMRVLRGRLQRAQAGRGSAVVLAAPSGIGKSRLLREAGLEAQVAGARVVVAAAESDDRSAYAVLRQLARELLRVATQPATDAARGCSGLIVRALPELHDLVPQAELRRAPGHPQEDRLRMQIELCEWIVEIAKRAGPLVVLVDDLQRCDEASAAVLATLAQTAPSHRLLLVATLRTDEPQRAPLAVAALQSAARTFTLPGLRSREIEELCRHLFGEAPNLARLASWLHRWGGDSPLYSTELVRSLVDRGIIRNVGGLWLLPEDFELTTPTGLLDAIVARLARLRPTTRALAETLSVHGGELTLELCMQLGDAADEPGVFSALDELTFEGILVGAGGSYRFRHDSLREALWNRLEPERRKRLHLRIGQALLQLGQAVPEREAEIGWHLLRGGEASRGAELLERAGRRLLEAQSFADAIPHLEAALQVYEQNGRPLRACAELRSLLVLAGTIAERAVALRYASSTLRAYQVWSGLAFAGRHKHRLGRRLSLALGLLWTSVRWLLSWPRRRGPSPFLALRSFITVAVYVGSLHMMSWNVPALRELVDMAEPLLAFGRRIPAACYHMLRVYLAFVLGDAVTVRASSNRVLDISAFDRATPLAEVDRRLAEWVMRYLAATPIMFHPRWEHLEAELSRISSLDLRTMDAAVLTLRASHHRVRGDEPKARELERRADATFLQLGSVWGAEAGLIAVTGAAYGIWGDLAGLRRVIDRLERLIAEGYQARCFLEQAQSDYFRELGEHERSREALERMALRAPDDQLVCSWQLAGLSETLLASGQHGPARRIAQRGLELWDREWDGVFPYCRVRCARTLALADAAEGEAPAGLRRIEQWLASTRELENPMLEGLLCEAGARIALAARDQHRYQAYLAQMERCLHPTGNPALLARIEHLRQLDRQTPPVRDQLVTTGSRSQLTTIRDLEIEPPRADSPYLMISLILSGSEVPDQRARLLLERFIGAAQAAGGWIYLLDQGRPRLAADVNVGEPGEDIYDRVHELLSDSAVEGDVFSEELVMVSAAGATSCTVPLRLGTGPRSGRFGVVVLTGLPDRLQRLTPELVKRIAMSSTDPGHGSAA